MSDTTLQDLRTAKDLSPVPTESYCTQALAPDYLCKDDAGVRYHADEQPAREDLFGDLDDNFDPELVRQELYPEVTSNLDKILEQAKSKWRRKC